MTIMKSIMKFVDFIKTILKVKAIPISHLKILKNFITFGYLISETKKIALHHNQFQLNSNLEQD